jgi:hypothetical protein
MKLVLEPIVEKGAAGLEVEGGGPVAEEAEEEGVEAAEAAVEVAAAVGKLYSRREGSLTTSPDI